MQALGREAEKCGDQLGSFRHTGGTRGPLIATLRPLHGAEQPVKISGWFVNWGWGHTGRWNHECTEVWQSDGPPQPNLTTVRQQASLCWWENNKAVRRRKHVLVFPNLLTRPGSWILKHFGGKKYINPSQILSNACYQMRQHIGLTKKSWLATQVTTHLLVIITMILFPNFE